MGVPENVEGLMNRRYFADTHYLALVCDADVQAGRPRARGSPWTEDSEGDYWADINQQVEFNEWFQTNHEAEGIDLLDNTDQPVEETATAVVEWLSNRLDSVSDGVIDQSS
jgi:hypothetical protein